MLRIMLLITLLGFKFSFAQSNFNYNEVPDSLREKYEISQVQILEIQDSLFSSAVNLEYYLPSSFSKDGDVDYTEFLQKGIDQNKLIVMPNFPIIVNENGLKFYSDSKVLFQKDSKLIMEPNTRAKYHLVLIENVKNIEMYYPKLEGDKYTHKSNKGQWGMGIWINQSENVNIINPIITKCWGDGIYIGNNGNKSSEDINIYNAFLDDNRRNGISITCGINIFITNALISNTSGQNPRSGIDIEPNTNADVIRNIVIDSPVTFNNAMHGIVISPGNLAGVKKKIISIEINNHTDYYSTIGLGISITRSNLEYPHPLEGAVYLNNSNFIDNSHSAIKNYQGAKNSVTVFLNGININSKRISEEKKSAFQLEIGSNLDAKIK